MLISSKVENRAASPADAAAIRHVHLSAFPTRMEADLVEQLERDGDTVLSIVAAGEDSHVVGHLLFSRMRVEGDGRPLAAIGLAPVAVIPDRQRRGIGSALIEEGLRQARSLGVQLVFVLGETEYYSRLGFTAAAALPFTSPYAGPYFQAAVLDPDYRPPASGTAAYAPAFQSLS